MEEEGGGWTSQEKKAVAIHQEITREINLLLTRIFAQRHKTGDMDLQVVELALCASLHQAGTTALTALLAFDPPSWEQRQLPCACGHTARYVELRSKPMLTAGARRSVCALTTCASTGVVVSFRWMSSSTSRTRNCPGGRRMLAAVGHEGPFEQGRRQMALLAGLSVTIKAVERTAEATREAKLGCAFSWVQLLFMRPVLVWHSAFKFMRVNS